MAKDFSSFSKALLKAKTEEEVKHAYAEHFGLDYDTEFRHDLYSPEIFFEFEFSRSLQKREARAAVLAQVLYYVRRLRLGYADKIVPPVICIADGRQAFFTETKKWQKFYGNEKKYDWELAPSQPDSQLVADLAAFAETNSIKVFDVLNEAEYDLFNQHLVHHRAEQLALDFRVKKLITEENFKEVFEYWHKCFGEAVRNGTKSSRYFLCDIQQGRSDYDRKENKVVFHIGPDENRAKKILPKEYEWFWSNYEKVTDSAAVRNILAKVDRLTDEPIRRFTGEFFTPVAFARKAHGYLEKVIGPKWWTKNYRLWDMAAGTGNLEWFLPADAYQSIYLSTLHHEDVQHCKRVFPGATVFQYDYLNDDVESVFDDQSLFDRQRKRPDNLLRDLMNPEIKWIIFINPPFATSQKAGYSGESKKGVSGTKIQPLMHQWGLGEVSRELFAQFLFRIRQEFAGKQAHLGLFSTLKYVNANNDQKFRDKVFQFGFKDGFVFSSANFSGTQSANAFPVGFLVWDLANHKKLEEQKMEVTILDDDTSKLGRKLIVSEHRDRFLSKWIDRVPATEILPPLGSAISVKGDNGDVRDRVAKGFLAYLMCKGNDVQNYNNVALLSGPYVSAGALSVVPENFDKAMVVHAVRKNVRKSWINDRDQFLQPKSKPGIGFVRQCAVWNLFADSNHTASLRNVAYKGRTFHIINHFFPFKVSVVKKWEISDSEISRSLQTDAADRFVAVWLAEQHLDSASAKLLEFGREIYKMFFKEFKNLPTAKYKVGHWDAGWWQIKRCLVEAGLEKERLDEIEEIKKQLGMEINGEALDLGIITSA
ncbi:MAG: hypothetical protein EXS35_14785 [Pedosphaera sp.]|nr:hypothetical protein [Pedosphaera sp.]